MNLNIDLDLSKMPISKILKQIAAYRGYTLTEVSEKFNNICGKNYSPVSFRNKLNNGAIRYDELQQIGKILGFEIDIKMH